MGIAELTKNQYKYIMASALVIFSGITFSYNVLDEAFAWAKENNASLKVLFLQEKPASEGYGFPSDIDAAENLADKADSLRADDQIIQGKIKQVLDKAKAEDVHCTTEVSTDHDIDTILDIAGDASVIMIDEGREEGIDDDTPLFDPEELVSAADCEVRLIKTA